MYLNYAKYVNRSAFFPHPLAELFFLHFVLEEYVGYKVYISEIGFLQLIILTGTVNASPASVSHFLDSKRNAFQTGVFSSLRFVLRSARSKSKIIKCLAIKLQRQP